MTRRDRGFTPNAWRHPSAKLRGYSWGALRSDLMAALIIAAAFIPQALAFGELAGLSPVAGLYTLIGAALGFSLLTSTRFVVVGPSATMAIMTFTAVHGRAAGNPARAEALAGLLAILVGLLCVALAWLRLRRISDLLSEPVMLGYLAGTGVVIFAGQLGVLIGVPAEGQGTLIKLWSVVTHLRQANPATAATGLTAVFLLLALQRYARRVPASLVVLAAAAITSAAFDLAGRGVAVVGSVTGEFHAPRLSLITGADIRALLPAALGMALIAIIQMIVAIRQTTDPRAEPVPFAQEGTALGLAGVVSGLLGGFAATASVPKSMSVRSSRARSQMFQVTIAVIAAIPLISGGLLASVLPLAALAATLITVAVPRLIDVAGFRLLWRDWRVEALIAIAAAVGVVVLGVLEGVLIAVVLALGQLVYRAANPHDAVLAAPAPGEPVPGPGEPVRAAGEDRLPRSAVLIYRIDAPLFFGNVRRVVERLLGLSAACGAELRYLILDAEMVFYLDASAADALAGLTKQLRGRGCELLLARTRAPVAAKLRANPYHHGATRDLREFPDVLQAYEYADRHLDARHGDESAGEQRSQA
jgi:sulfate permease, SulP family